MINYIKDLLEEQSKDRNILSLEDLPEPSLLPGIKEGSKRIIKLLKKNKKLLVVGDYDCDGIKATTILTDFLRRAGFENQIDFIIPDRFIDGYGVSKNMVDYAIKNDFDFIVTVDNGIGAKEAVKYATDNDIEVIITDHHTPGDQVPEVDLIINPKFNLGDFPFKEISGATVAWFLCCQIREDLNLQIDMRDWLDLVGITVISDVMPLKSMNVTFVKYAINAIKNKKRFIFELAFDSNKRATLTEEDIGFGYVPMINAVGRIDHAKHAVNLLLQKDKREIVKGYKYLVDINNKRKYLNQDLLNKILPEAEKQIKNGQKVLVIKQELLHEGIVGILAGKLAEKYNVPTYVFGWNNAKQCYKGSGRSAGNINLYDLTEQASNEALGFGGHKGAVGVAIKKGDFDKWSKKILKSAENIESKEFEPIGPKPIECDLSIVNKDLIEILNQYRPFGEGFEFPKFKTTVFLNVKNVYKEGLHWNCTIIDKNGVSCNALFFHDRNVGKYDLQEVEILFEPKLVRNNEGYTIELKGYLAD